MHYQAIKIIKKYEGTKFHAKMNGFMYTNKNMYTGKYQFHRNKPIRNNIN